MEAMINALLGLIMGTLLGGWLERVLYRPKVKMEVRGRSIYEHGSGRFVSVMAFNKGATAAQNCRGAITIHNLSKESLLDPKEALENEKLPVPVEEQLLTPDNFRDVDRELLCWANIGNPSEYTINPSMKTYLDVCKMVKKPDTDTWYFIIPSESGWNKIRARLKDGNYEGEITISPENGTPEIQRFKIRSSRDSDANHPTFEVLPR